MPRRLRYCSVISCENNRGTTSDDVPFFRFPLMGSEKYFHWVMAIKKLNVDCRTETNSQLCILHFNKNDIIERTNSKGVKLYMLRLDAVPTIGTKEPTIVEVKQEQPDENIEYVDVSAVKSEPIENVPTILNGTESVEIVPSVCNDRKLVQYIRKCPMCDMSEVQVNNLNALLKSVQQKCDKLQKENELLKVQVRQLKVATKPMPESTKIVKKIRCQVCFVRIDENQMNKHLCMDRMSKISCEYCSASFESTVDLGSHLKEINHPNIQFYKCSKCTMAFPTAIIRTFHENSKYIHDDFTMKSKLGKSAIEKLFKCSECEKSFKQPKELGEHMRLSHPHFECYICNIKFDSLRSVKHHLKEHIAARDKKCEICDEKLTSNELNSHLCHTESSIKCEYCHSLFNATIKLLKHLDSEHDDRTLYHCRKCSKFFGMIQLRNLHEKRHKELEKPFVCEICSKSFSGKHLLQAHLLCHSSEKQFLCSECGKGFKSANSLAKHDLTHAEKTIKCPDCPATFNRPQYLRNHQAIHQNFKYKCDICGLEAMSKIGLKRHIKLRHTKYKADQRFECTFCSFKFDKKFKLTTHLRSHTGETPFICEFCTDRKYRYKGDLKKHLQTHVGNNIYNCEVCGKGFRLQAEYKQHSFVHYKEDKEKSNANVEFKEEQEEE